MKAASNCKKVYVNQAPKQDSNPSATDDKLKRGRQNGART